MGISKKLSTTGIFSLAAMSVAVSMSSHHYTKIASDHSLLRSSVLSFRNKYPMVATLLIPTSTVSPNGFSLDPNNLIDYLYYSHLDAPSLLVDARVRACSHSRFPPNPA